MGRIMANTHRAMEENKLQGRAEVKLLIKVLNHMSQGQAMAACEGPVGGSTGVPPVLSLSLSSET